MMKRIVLLALTALLSGQVAATQDDSVYLWGAWAEGLKPAAGPAAKVTPPPAERPDVSFRPNENSAFLREATVAFRAAPPPAPGVPPSPTDAVVPIDTQPSNPRDQF